MEEVLKACALTVLGREKQLLVSSEVLSSPRLGSFRPTHQRHSRPSRREAASTAGDTRPGRGNSHVEPARSSEFHANSMKFLAF